MKLSNQESKYRTKFIQECYYNKEESKQFDNIKNELNMTYKKLYQDLHKGIVHMFMATIAANRLSSAIIDVGYATEELVNAFERFSIKELLVNANN